MVQPSSCIRHGVRFCALGALIFSAACGSFARVDAAAESVGGAAAAAGSGAGGATTGAGSGGGGAGGAGLPLWSKAFRNAYPYSVAVDPSGNIVIAGYFHHSLDFGGSAPLNSAGGRDAFVVKLDPSGKALWGKSFGDASDQWVRSIAVDSAGNVIITGDFQDSIDFGGGPLVTIGPFKLVFVAKLDPSGNHLWSKGFGDGSGLDSFVAVDGSGDVLLTGGLKSTVDLGGGPLQERPTSVSSS